MSESDEPSYYEVALTRRQVTVAFVVLLVCMIAAFLAGVWVARDGQPVPPSLAVATPGSGPAQLPEYRFFSDRTAEGAAPVAAAAGSVAPLAVRPEAVANPDATLLADIGGTPPPSTNGAGASLPESESEPPAGNVVADAVPSAASATPLPPLPAAALAVAKASPPRPVPEPGSIYRQLAPGELAVQVFSSADEEQARLVLRKLKAAGYTMFLSPVDTGGKYLFRVRIGPYSDRATAQRVSDEVKQRFGYQPWIAK